VAPQNVVEFWSVATRPVNENGLGMDARRADAEITTLLRLFRLLPYRQEVLETRYSGGEGGIRTHGRVTPSTVFETARFNRSRTSPGEFSLIVPHRQTRTRRRSLLPGRSRELAHRSSALP
jgi:hypothetical protein